MLRSSGRIIATRLTRVAAAAGISAMIVVGTTTTPVRAEIDYGQACLQMTSYSDTFRMAITVPNGAEPIASLNIRWRAFGYQILGTGSATLDDSGDIQMDVHGVHGSASFDGNPICSAHAVLDANSLDGNMEVVCVGGVGAPYSVSTGVELTTCDSSMALPQSGPTLGDR